MRRIALIPSANEYADDLIPDLLGAEADGLRMGELLASKAGFEVIPVTGPRLTKKAFTQAVLDAVNTLKAGDMFLLYAPMHATLWRGEQFLVCPEADLAGIEESPE